MKDKGEVGIIQGTPWLSMPRSLPRSAPCLAYGTIPWAPHISALKVSALGPYCIDFLWLEKSPCFPLFYLNDVSLHSRLRETPSNIEFGSSSSTWSYNSRVTIKKSGLIFPLISSLSVIYFFSSTFRSSVHSLNTKILESFCVVVLSAFYFTETKVNVLTPNTASNSHFCDLIIML